MRSHGACTVTDHMGSLARPGEGATNVIVDKVGLGGTLRALTMHHFGHMRARITEASCAATASDPTRCRALPLGRTPSLPL